MVSATASGRAGAKVGRGVVTTGGLPRVMTSADARRLAIKSGVCSAKLACQPRSRSLPAAAGLGLRHQSQTDAARQLLCALRNTLHNVALRSALHVREARLVGVDLRRRYSDWRQLAASSSFII
jgi:hypothetical protein